MKFVSVLLCMFCTCILIAIANGATYWTKWIPVVTANINYASITISEGTSNKHLNCGFDCDVVSGGNDLAFMRYDFEIQEEASWKGMTVYVPLTPEQGYSSFEPVHIFGAATVTHSPSWSDVEYLSPLTANSYQVICEARNYAYSNSVIDSEIKVLTL